MASGKEIHAKILRLIDIWAERAVFVPQQIQELRSACSLNKQQSENSLAKDNLVDAAPGSDIGAKITANVFSILVFMANNN